MSRSMRDALLTMALWALSAAMFAFGVWLWNQ